MLARRHGVAPPKLLVGRAVAAALALACLHCPSTDDKDRLYEPVPLEAHEVKISADAQGDARSPAHVTVFLQRGALSVRGGAGHTVEGVATGALGDAPPRLSLMQDRVALTQSALGGTPPSGDAKFVLALGDTPMSLEVNTRAGDPQSIDLGGVAVAKGTFTTGTGRMTLDWSSPGAFAGAALTFTTDSGYVEASHVARSAASSIGVTAAAGLVRLDFGDFAALPASPAGVPVTATVTTGTFILAVPPGAPAIATVQAPPGTLVLRGWRRGSAPGTYVSGPDGAAPRVTARVTAEGGHVELHG